VWPRPLAHGKGDESRGHERDWREALPVRLFARTLRPQCLFLKVIAFVGGAAVWQYSPPSGVLHLAISFDVT
jgi:hypothetical protein